MIICTQTFFFPLRRERPEKKVQTNPETGKELGQAESGLGVEFSGALRKLKPWKEETWGRRGFGEAGLSSVSTNKAGPQGVGAKGQKGPKMDVKVGRRWIR